MAERDQDDQTEEPTQRRLDEALEKGEIIYSAEVATALSLLAATLVVALLAGPMARAVGAGALAFLERPHAFAADPRALMAVGADAAGRVGAALGVAFLAFIGAGVAARYLQDRPAFTTARLAPKLEKLDPIKGFGRVFGPSAWGQLGKGLLKLAIVGGAVAWVIWPRDGALERLAFLDVGAVLPFVRERALALMWACLWAVVAIAAVDYLFTRQAFRKRLRMSKQELKEEFRQSEGDPHVRMKLRQLRQERASKRMLAQVPRASVVITNPTHYAVALRYEPGVTPAPICLAKGVDATAMRIRAAAEGAGVPVMEDPPLARALFAAADLDQPIPRAHYEAVAKIIGVVLGLAQRRQATGRGANQDQ